MIRYNPCGRIVDVGRRPYTTKARFWKDEEEENDIVWYTVPWTNPVLGYPSRIQSLDQKTFPWVAEGVGEVYNVPRPYNGKRASCFLNGHHVCGTQLDFEVGGTRDDTKPPVEYNRDGIPICCQPPFCGLGGLVIGGTADVTVTPAGCPAPAVVVGQAVHYADTVPHSNSTAWVANAGGFGLPGALGNIFPSLRWLLQWGGVGFGWGFGIDFLAPGSFSAIGPIVSCTANSVSFRNDFWSFSFFPLGTIVTITW